MKVLLVLALVVCAVEANRKCWKCIQSDDSDYSKDALKQYSEEFDGFFPFFSRNVSRMISNFSFLRLELICFPNDFSKGE